VIFSSADAVVKLAMVQPAVLASLFDPLDRDRLRPEVTVKVLKAIKQLSMDHNTLGYLHRAGVIRRLVRVIARREGAHITDMYNHALSTMFNLCRLNMDRQLTAAQDGVVPHLMHVTDSLGPMRQLALPMLCELAHVKRARGELWKHNCVEFYLEVLANDR
jgi:hypothetical protein